MFRRAEAIRPGSEKILLTKATVMEANLVRSKIPAGEDFMSRLIRKGKIDMYVAYASGINQCLDKKSTPITSVGRLSPDLRVGANYRLRVLKDAKPEAYQLALFILSEKGLEILQRNGFIPISLTD